MKSALTQQRAGFALSMMLLLSLSACSPASRIVQAASETGKARAGVILPVLPGECRQTVPHAVAGLGANAVAVLARERAQLDRANGVIGRCAAHYDTIKAGLEER